MDAEPAGTETNCALTVLKKAKFLFLPSHGSFYILEQTAGTAISLT